MKRAIIMLALITSTQLSFAQLIGNIEATVNQLKSPTAFSFGGSLQYLVYADYHFLPGINAGAMVEIDNHGQNRALSFPINLQARYYVVGRHACCGGGYVEANGGVKIRKPMEVQEGMEVTQEILPQGNIGVGYRFPMSYEYCIRWGAVLNNGKTEPYVGVKFGYTF